MVRKIEPTKKTLHVSLPFDVKLVNRIDEYAQDNGIATRASAVRELIRLGLAAADKEK